MFDHWALSMSTYTVRIATPDDAATIVEFNARLATETEERTLDRNLLRRGVEALLADAAKGTYFVAIHGAAIVGQLMITYEWSDWRNGMFWWIQSVYVKPEERGKGVFGLLYGYLLEEAKRRGGIAGLRLYVDHANTRAQTTYAKLGMKKSGYEMFETDFVLG